MAQEIKYLLCMYQDPSLGFQNLLKSDVVSNSSVPVVRWRIRGSSWMRQLAWGRQWQTPRDPVSNQVEGKGRHARLCSELHWNAHTQNTRPDLELSMWSLMGHRSLGISRVKLQSQIVWRVSPSRLLEAHDTGGTSSD